jgi:hypothetical protein
LQDLAIGTIELAHGSILEEICSIETAGGKNDAICVGPIA